MTFYRLCLIFCIFTGIIQALFLAVKLPDFQENYISAQQRPPLPVNSNEECHIIDAVPLLGKKYYKSSGYKLTILKAKPLIIQESIAADKFLDLKIEQRGCEDVYAKFNYTFKGKKNYGIKRNLRDSAQTLKNLKINSSTLVPSQTILKIAKIALRESKKDKPFKDRVVCLSQIQTECITNVSFTYKYPHLHFFYVDRP